MKVSPFSPADLATSVVSVPPLAWTDDHDISVEANREIIRRLDAGGVTTYLYGGNANLQNLPIGLFSSLLSLMHELGPASAWMIPSIGPDFGKALDQARIARGRQFPVLMTLPAGNATTQSGLASGMRRLSDAAGVPLMGYIRTADYMAPSDLKALAADGVICAVKYAVENVDPSDDRYLAAICDAIGPQLVVSGMGERPALTHLKKYDLAGFTSGAICVAPALSMSMLSYAKSADFGPAEAIRQKFVPLEDLRERSGPVPVLHAALDLAGIAKMGPLQPYQAPVDVSLHGEIKSIVQELTEAAVEHTAAV